MTNIDEHGQPDDRALNWSRLKDHRIDELIGLCRGILADGAIVFEEIVFVHDWLRRNVPVRRTIFGSRLFTCLDEIVAVNRMSDKDEERVVDLIMKLVGGRPENVADSSMSSQLPLDDPPPAVAIPSRSFCFTGKMTFGSRSDCQKAVVERGGRIHQNPRRDTMFMVIGDVGSRDWVHSTHGRKIEKAIEIREKGGQIALISEAHWRSALGGIDDRMN